MTDAVKLPPMPEDLFSEFWTLMSAWELSSEGDDAEAAGDKLEIFIKDRMRAYAIHAVMQERERNSMLCLRYADAIQSPLMASIVGGDKGNEKTKLFARHAVRKVADAIRAQPELKA